MALASATACEPSLTIMDLYRNGSARWFRRVDTAANSHKVAVSSIQAMMEDNSSSGSWSSSIVNVVTGVGKLAWFRRLMPCYVDWSELN